MNTATPYDRYQRQLILKGFGLQTQDKLIQAKVLVIGAGGLGCPVLQYLVAAGVGEIGVADHDKVSLSNLHRQILFGTNDIGRFKVDVVKEKMGALNPDLKMRTWQEQWTQQHCVDYFPEYDVIVDATDNFASRYLINDAAVLMGKPVVFGAVSQYEGQVAVFNLLKVDGSRSVNYRHLFPEPPQNGEVLNCAEGGVLGVLPGIIGVMQATEVIKILTGIGTPLVDKLWNYQALTQDVFIADLEADASIAQGIPASVNDFLQTDYEQLCSIPQYHLHEMSIVDWQQEPQPFLLIDIREKHERPKLQALSAAMEFSLLELPLSEFESGMKLIESKNVVIVCQAGRRSLQAVQLLMNNGYPAHVYSLKGGVNAMIGHKIIGYE
jgi:molybdopterin/thiamine biosynthesis adenylyltransferase/rhodanese-related sulfurtransferase